MRIVTDFTPSKKHKVNNIRLVAQYQISCPARKYFNINQILLPIFLNHAKYHIPGLSFEKRLLSQKSH